MCVQYKAEVNRDNDCSNTKEEDKCCGPLLHIGCAVIVLLLNPCSILFILWNLVLCAYLFWKRLYNQIDSPDVIYNLYGSIEAVDEEEGASGFLRVSHHHCHEGSYCNQLHRQSNVARVLKFNE